MPSTPQARNVYIPIAWFFGVLSALGNLVLLVSAISTLTLQGHSYAQADLGLFMMLIMIGVPILVSCGSMLLIGVLLRPRPIQVSIRSYSPLEYLLAGNLVSRPI
jgi:hypothetical protein